MQSVHEYISEKCRKVIAFMHCVTKMIFRKWRKKQVNEKKIHVR